MALYPNSGFPFYRGYPYTNFEQLNLDAILNEVGRYSRRISDLETLASNHEVRITNNTNDITDLKERMTAAENDIDSLEDATGDLKDRVDGIDDSLETITGDISDIKGDISDIEGDIGDINTALNGKADATDLDALTNRVQGINNDIIALDSRIDDLEEHSVIANKGGSTTGVLSTLEVDGVNYEVPQGGGGGGSTVIPNASGTPTADLETIGVDGYVYSIPSGVDTSDLIADEYDTTDYYDTGDLVIYDGTLYRALEDSITGAWDSTKWVETTIAEECQDAGSTATAVYNMYADLGTAYEDDAEDLELDTRATGMDALPGINHTLTPGSWIVTLNATFDTHELGSRQRTINIYLVDGNDDIIAQFGKYMWGSEAVTGILYANSCTLSAVVNVPYGTIKTIYGKVAVRIQSGSGTYQITDVKLGSVRIKPYAA